MENSKIIISKHEHGKGRVRVVKVTRTDEKHFIQQMEVQVVVHGTAAETSYYSGDNSGVIPTDTIKNTVYVLAKKYDFNSIEEFGILLAKYFVEHHLKLMQQAKVKIIEENWSRINSPDSNGVMKPHHHAFVSGGSETYYTLVEAISNQNQIDLKISSGLSGLKVMKTTQSSFEKFAKDEYTTLPEVDDRLVGTVVKAEWKYNSERCRGLKDFKNLALSIRNTILETFAGPSDTGTPSAAVQYTLYKIGEAVLKRTPAVDEIQIYLPNVHNIPVDLDHFGLKNIHPHGEIFMPIDEPHGMIEATVSRNIKSRL